jgi:uncharacterized Rmd1/YagE family protein
MARKNGNKKTHRLVAMAFREDFDLPKMPLEWKSTHSFTETKDSKVKSALGGGLIYAYNFGALTFVNVDPAERTAAIGELRELFSLDPDSNITSEEYLIEEDPDGVPKVEYSKVVLDAVTPERLAVISQTIAQSVEMEYYERVVGKVKTKVRDLTAELQISGRIKLSTRKLYKVIGEAMVMRSEVIGVLHLLDKPDIIWEDKVMDGLYDDLRKVFDLPDRFKALEYKLKAIQETLDILVETVRDSRLYNADLCIILLIVVEVAFSLMTRFHWLGW